MPKLNFSIQPYLLWFILAAPCTLFAYNGFIGSNYHQMVHPTGEFAARFMIITMVATPLQMIFRKQKWTLWLVRNRRYFGVAAFILALLHTVFYLADKSDITRILSEFWETGIWTGWLAFLIFIPLALTSNDLSMRMLRKSWKTLQRFVYPAAVLTLIHWLFIAHGPAGALVHFVPLGFLEAYRIWHRFRKKVVQTA